MHEAVFPSLGFTIMRTLGKADLDFPSNYNFFEKLKERVLAIL